MNKTKLAVLLMLISSASYSQVIVNAYAKVTNVSGTTITLSNVDESADSFEDNDYVILMQMQGNVIGSTADDATFGNLGTIGSTGLYEIIDISSHTESGGVPTTITFKRPLSNTYSIGTNSSLQVISFPSFGSPNYTTTFDMVAKAWNGNTGGVLAINVDGVLTLANNLSASQRGFRGAGPNAGGSAGCDGNNNFRVISQDNMADKGESIYKNTNTGYAAGMGKILNGGGGGNSHNGGGGGGGNYGSGGNGGPGWPTCSPSAGGLGGLGLSAYISATRIFMGGGGGAGEGNNNLATDGGDGGGIIILRALEIQTTGSCGGITISSNGESIAFAGNDGGGGAGAAGSIIIEVSAWSISPSCPVSVSAIGGNGGGVNNSATHGGGGGGGQGVIMYSIAQPTGNTTSTTASGTGGCNNNSNPCSSVAGTGGGGPNAGIFDLTSGPLPVELVAFEASLTDDRTVRLDWITASETNCDYFEIQRAGDDLVWETIGKEKGAGNSSQTLHYLSYDTKPFTGLTYYRLKQVDFDGSANLSAIRKIDLNADGSDVSIYPNPSNGMFNIESEAIELTNLRIYNALGQDVTNKATIHVQNSGFVQLNLSGLRSGFYFINTGKTHHKIQKI